MSESESVCELRIKESDQHADQRDANQHEHNSRGRHFLLAHQPIAEHNGSQRQHLGEYGIQHILLKGNITGQDERRCDRDPACGDCADNDRAEHDDALADGVRLFTDDHLNRLAAELIALEVQQTHAEGQDDVVRDDIEDRAERRAARGHAERNTQQNRDERADEQAVTDTGDRAHQTGADTVDHCFHMDPT